MKRYKNIVLAVLVALTLVVSVIAPRIAFADSNEISALAVDKYTREPIEGVHVVIYQGGSTIVAEVKQVLMATLDLIFHFLMVLIELNRPLIKKAMFLRSTLFLTFLKTLHQV